MVGVRVTPALIDLFRTARLGTVPVQGERFRVGDRIEIEPGATIERYAHLFTGQVLPMAMGSFSYTYSAADPWVSIGRYCSIAHDVAIMGSDHPLDWASSSLFSYHPFPMGQMRTYMDDVKAMAFALHKFTERPKTVTMGHDVWIGGRVMIKRGISIGTGAAIAAGSVVTRDVAPYAVVAGVPARAIRQRFDDATAARLLDSQWWRFGPDKLQSFDVRDPVGFADRVMDAAADGLAPLDPTGMTGEQIIAAGERISA